MPTKVCILFPLRRNHSAGNVLVLRFHELETPGFWFSSNRCREFRTSVEMFLQLAVVNVSKPVKHSILRVCTWKKETNESHQRLSPSCHCIAPFLHAVEALHEIAEACVFRLHKVLALHRSKRIAVISLLPIKRRITSCEFYGLALKFI